tara:strand:- start:71 stop:595 length:525 start_codon:yes stop_codon:yes gene_type:complete
VVSQLKVNEIIKQSGSSITIGEAGDTVSGPFTNVPAFFVSLGSAQSIGNSSRTVLQLDTVDYDTNSLYSTSTYRFTVTTGFAGKYWFAVASRNNNWTSNRHILYITKNGSSFAENEQGSAGSYHSNFLSATIDMAVGDYVSAEFFQDAGSSKEVSGDFSGTALTFMTGYRLIGA